MSSSTLVCLLAAFTSVCAEPMVVLTYQQIITPGTGTVRCIFPTPLTDCRLRVSEVHNGFYDGVLDFGRGPQSKIVTWKRQGGAVLATARYDGHGLAAGHCGVQLRMSKLTKQLTHYVSPFVKPQVVLVECFGQSGGGDWDRGVGLLTAHNWDVLAASSPTPHRVVVQPGSEVAVLLQAQGSVQHCTITFPPVGRVNLTPGTALRSHYRAHGAGADRGDCGAVVADVQQRNAGVWSWEMTQTILSTRFALRATMVLVKDTPLGNPTLGVANAGKLRVGGMLNATCRAPPSVPPANITWLLDGLAVRQDPLNDTLSGDVGTSRPWEPQPAVQTFIRRLTAEDRGRLLECRIEHVGLDGPVSVSHLLRIAAASGLNPEPTPHQPYVPAPLVPPPSLPTPPVPTPPVPAPGEYGCPPLPTHVNGVRCTLGGLNIACGNASQPVGTAAYLVCAEGFHPRENLPRFLNTTCTPNGWRPLQFVCDLDCGVRANASHLLSPGEKDAQLPEFPWHVAVFEKDEGSYYPLCGGSLIAVNFFISAAHCYYDDPSETPLNASLYMAAVGKLTPSWKTRDKLEQRRAIRAIHINEHFSGTSKNLEADLALVELSEAVDITLAVGAVCVDWKTVFANDQFKANITGVVPVWGVSASNSPTSTLRLVDLPFAPFRQCQDAVSSDFNAYLIGDKICGGSRARLTPICQGDAGAGYVFASKKTAGERYFVRGVLSSAQGQTDDSDLTCQDERMATFTVISLYVQWLKRIVLPAGEEDDEY